MSPDALLHVGVSKTGKTFALRREVERAIRRKDRHSKGHLRRFVVLDRLSEWEDITVRHARGESDSDATSALRHDHELVILTPPRANKRDRGDLPAIGERMATIGLERGVTVVLPEAHLYAPKGGKIEPQLTELITAYRHYGAGLWTDTQRFASIHESVISQAEIIRLFGQRSLRDLKRVRDEGGEELEALVEEALRLTYAGEPGWYAEIGSTVDYRLERFGAE